MSGWMSAALRRTQSLEEQTGRYFGYGVKGYLFEFRL